MNHGKHDYTDADRDKHIQGYARHGDAKSSAGSRWMLHIYYHHSEYGNSYGKRVDKNRIYYSGLRYQGAQKTAEETNQLTSYYISFLGSNTVRHGEDDKSCSADRGNYYRMLQTQEIENYKNSQGGQYALHDVMLPILPKFTVYFFD